MSRTLPALLWAALPAVPGSVDAQQVDPETRCFFEAPTASSTRLLEFGQWKTVTETPNIRCTDGRRVRADEMTTYEASGLTVFTGNVYFQDNDQTLRSYTANYTERLGRLEAAGGVELIDLETGTELYGQQLLYERAGESFGRTEERIVVFGGSPSAILYPSASPPDSADIAPPPLPVEADSADIPTDSLGVAADSAAVPTDSLGAVADSAAAAADSTEVETAPQADPGTDVDAEAGGAQEEEEEPEPYEVFAQEIEIRGEDYFRARGRAKILRGELDARADSIEYLQEEGTLYLDGNAIVDQPETDLSAREIVMRLPGDVLRDLIARGDGRLLGDRIEMAAPFIRVELDEGEIQGLWAARLYRPGVDSLEVPLRTALPGAEPDSADFVRPIALSEDVEMTGDSIDVRAPAQILERVIAIGGARAVSHARDSMNTEETPELIREDWIEGDTVVAVFTERDPELVAAEREAGEEPREFALERLEASGEEARSLYRLEPSEDAEPGPLEPVPEDSVVVFGAGADQDTAQVADPTGVTDAPPVDSIAPGELAGDSLAAPADSLAAEGEAAEPPQPPRLAIHYVVANRIIIRMTDGEVDVMEVRGLQRGMHQEPRRPAGSQAAGGTQ